jgi:hypothetical protein
MNEPSRLEIFPDELFLDLFSYISPIELYYIWNNLNHRLSAIIRSVRISFDFIENTIDNNRVLNYFSQQIIYIRLCISNELLDLKQFQNIRSLIIDTKLTKDQLNSIQPTILPYLQRLTFSEWWKDKEPLNEIIFNRENSHKRKCSWLKVCHLPSIPNYFLMNTSKLSYIQTMIFDRVTLFDINLILSLQTTLRRLKVTIVACISDEKISKISNYNQNYQHQHLIHFDITINTYNKLDDLYPLLSHLSSLRYLYIACDSLSMNDFKQLAFELNTRVPWLENFNCSFKQTFIQDMDKLHSMSPLFRHMICEKIEWKGGWHYYSVTKGNAKYR